MKLLRFAFFAFVVGIPPCLFAEENSPLFLSLMGGGGSAFSPSGISTLHKDPLFFGGRLGYQLSDRWSVGAQLSKFSIGSDTAPAQDIRLSPLTAWAQRDFLWTRLWTPYVLASLGVSRNSADSFSNGRTNTGWIAGLSLGMKFKISDMQDLSLEVGARQFSRATGEGKNLRLVDAGLVLRFFLPESWVPLKPNVDISDADLEIPLVSDEPEVELDSAILAQEELNLLQREIDSKKYSPISFDPGSAILQTTSFEALDTLGAIFRRYPEVKVRIYGFVEEGYPQENSEALALARSQVVGTYIVQNFYLNESRFNYLGEPPLPPPEAGVTPPPTSRRIRIEIQTER